MGDKQNSKGKKGKGKSSSSHKGLNGNASPRNHPMVGRAALSVQASPTSSRSQIASLGTPQATPPSTPDISPAHRAANQKLYSPNKLSSPPAGIKHLPRHNEAFNGPPNVVEIHGQPRDIPYAPMPTSPTSPAGSNPGVTSPTASTSSQEDEQKNGLSRQSLSSSVSSSSVESAQSVRLRETPVTPNAVRPKTFTTELSPAIKPTQAEPHSPGNQSLASTTSVATNASVLTVATPSEYDGRQRLTLGEIISQVEFRSKVLLRKDNFTTPDTLLDMQFLAHQSRYSSDLNIKRRLISKLIENGLLEIFIKVFYSVHTVDYLKSRDDHGTDGQNDDDTSQSDNKSETKSLDGRSVPNGNDCSDSVSMRSVEINDAIELPQDPKALSDKYPNASDSLKNLRAAITLMWNATDKSPHLCEDCIRRGLIRLLLEDLTDPRLAASELKDPNRLYLVKGYLGILYNLIRYYNDTREMFREYGAVKILQQFLKSSLLMVKTKTIMLLTYLINESENDIINSSDKNLGFVLKMLQSTLESENHFSKKYGYWAVEVTAAVNRLASCESNKERLLKKGALALYLRLLEPSCSEEEQLIATQGIWMFSFNENNKKAMLEDPKCMQVLEGLVNGGAREEIRRAAKGAVWVLEGNHNKRQSTPGPSAASSEPGHVMISYQWAAKHVLLKLRDRLKSAGYKVWMDADNMIGASLESSVEAVDKSSVVLVCMTQKYKDSPSCRTEAEYACRRRKDILPLRIQPKYNADGWFGRLIGAKMYFDFSREENLEIMMANLIRELGQRGRIKQETEAEVSRPVTPASITAMPSPALTSSHPLVYNTAYACPSPVPQSFISAQMLPITNNHIKARSVSPGPSEAATEDRYNKVLSWATEDVIRWLKENELNSVTDKFKHINGELLLQVLRMQKAAPETFYTTLRKELGFSFVSTLKFTKALEKL